MCNCRMFLISSCLIMFFLFWNVSSTALTGHIRLPTFSQLDLYSKDGIIQLYSHIIAHRRTGQKDARTQAVHDAAWSIVWLLSFRDNRQNGKKEKIFKKKTTSLRLTPYRCRFLQRVARCVHNINITLHIVYRYQSLFPTPVPSWILACHRGFHADL